MIALWTKGHNPDLYLLASPKSDFTRKLLQYARPYSGDLVDAEYQVT